MSLTVPKTTMPTKTTAEREAARAAGYAAAVAYAKGEMSEAAVQADYASHDQTSTWYAGWMTGIREHYFRPFN